MKVISGAQTGVDQAALEAAEAVGIETGGYIPVGGRTETGKRPDLITRFNLCEMGTYSYSPRTFKNVQHSDGTIRYAAYLNSPGEKLTLKYINQLARPNLTIEPASEMNPEKVVAWLYMNQIVILNVAGNCESTCPGIQEKAFKYFVQVFTRWKQEI